MIIISCAFHELLRIEKITIDNCYDTNSDINIFADTKNIVITLQSTQ